jgi:hypothetical protein
MSLSAKLNLAPCRKIRRRATARAEPDTCNRSKEYHDAVGSTQSLHGHDKFNLGNVCFLTAQLVRLRDSNVSDSW